MKQKTTIHNGSDFLLALLKLFTLTSTGDNGQAQPESNCSHLLYRIYR